MTNKVDFAPPSQWPDYINRDDFMRGFDKSQQEHLKSYMGEWAPEPLKPLSYEAGTANNSAILIVGNELGRSEYLPVKLTVNDRNIVSGCGISHTFSLSRKEAAELINHLKYLFKL